MKRFNGICILTKDVERLGNFYQEVLQVGVERDGDNLTFATDGAQLSIFSYQGIEQMVPGIMEGAGFGSLSVDFEVEDVNEVAERMKQIGAPCVKPPISYPWGRRSAWFRDPDGNIVNFYQRI